MVMIQSLKVKVTNSVLFSVGYILASMVSANTCSISNISNICESI